MKVWIDGDACPDIKKLVSLCHKYQVPVAIVCDDSHEFQLDEVKMVSTGFQSADMYLLNQIQDHDFVITSDYGVAIIALMKNCIVLNPNSTFYTKENMDYLLLQRHVNAKLRKQNLKVPHQKKRNEVDRNVFLEKVESILKTSR